MVSRALLASLAALFFLSACSADKSARTRHEGPRAGSTAVVLRAGSIQPAELEKIHEERFALSTQLHNKKTSSKEISAILTRLSPFVLKVDYMENPKTRGADGLSDALYLYNTGLLRLMEIDRSMVEQKGYLKDYLRVMMADCEDGELKDCSYLAFFRKDSAGTANVLLKVSQEYGKSLDVARKELLNKSAGYKNCPNPTSCAGALKTTIDTYNQSVDNLFLYLTAAYELKSGPYSSDLDLLFVRYAKDFFERKKSAGEADMVKMRRFRDGLNLALLQIRDMAEDDSISRKEYCDYVIQSSPMTFDVQESELVDTRGLRSFISEFVKCASQRNILESLVRKQLEEDRTLQTAKADAIIADPSKPTFEDEGYPYALKFVSASSFMMKGLGIQDTQRYDLLQFVVDRLYYEKIDKSVAYEYWKRYKPTSDDDVINFVRNYVRVQAAYVLKSSMLTFAEFLKQQIQERKGLGVDLFDDVVTYMNSRVYEQWEQLKLRIRMVEEFMILVYDSKYKSGDTSSKIANTASNYVILKDQMEQVSEHFNYLAVSPLTLAMSYYMSKAQGTISFRMNWWPAATSGSQLFTVLGENALLKFFEDDDYFDKPLFRFGDAMLRMSDIQKMHSLDLAMRVGLFEFIPFYLYEPDQQLLIYNDKYLNRNNEYLFYKKYIQDYLRTDDTDLPKKLNDMKNLAKNQDLEKYLLACRDPFNTTLQMDTASLYAGTMVPITSTNSSMYQVVQEVYGAFGDLSDFRTKYRSVLKLQHLLELHFTSDQAKDILPAEKYAVRREILAYIKAELARFRSQERAYYDLAFRTERRIVNDDFNCLRRIYEADWIRREALLLENAEYYRDVHAAMSLLLAAKDLPENEINNVAALHKAVTAYTTPLIGSGGATKFGGLDYRMHRLVNRLHETNLLQDLTFSRQTNYVLEESLNVLLNIHNYDVKPFGPNAGTKNVQYGFYMENGPAYSSTKVELKPKNRITATQFSQAQWDTLVRLRSQLYNLEINPKEYQVEERLGLDYGNKRINIGRSLILTIPGSFVGLADYGPYKEEAKIDYTPFHPNPEVFVRQAMTQLAGAKTGGNMSLAWFTPGGDVTAPRVRRMRILEELYEYGGIELADTDVEKCAHDEWGDVVAPTAYDGKPIKESGQTKDSGCRAIRVTGREVINEFLELADMYNLSLRMRNLLLLVDRQDIYLSDIEKYFKYRKEESTSQWTYFDEYFRTHFATVDMTSGNATVQVETFRGRYEFKHFLESMATDILYSHHLFDLGKTGAQVQRDTLRRIMFMHLGQIQEVEEAIKDLEEDRTRPELPTLVFQRTDSPRRDELPLMDGQWRSMSVKRRANGTPIYLEETHSAEFWFQSFLTNYFTNETTCEALTQPTDPDGKARPEMVVMPNSTNCPQRYKAWDQVRQAERMRIRQLRRAGE